MELLQKICMPHRCTRISERCRLLYSFAATVALVGSMGACHPSPQAEYRVIASTDDTSHIHVRVWLSNTPRGPVVLTGHATEAFMGLDSLACSDTAGKILKTDYELMAVGTRSGQRVKVPRVTIETPHPTTLVLSYRVKPGTREGDSHTGYSGRICGFMNSHWAMITGRGLFLLPDERVFEHFRVTCDLPSNWIAKVPWKTQLRGFVPWQDGVEGAEGLIAGTIGLGAYDEIDTVLGATRYRFAFPRESGVEAVRLWRERLSKIIEATRMLCSHELGPEYLLIGVPKSPGGNDVLGESWGTGQGGTLLPGDGDHIHAFAKGVLEAHLIDAPYRLAIKRREDFWLCRAVVDVCSWTIIDHAREQIADISRPYAARYLESITHLSKEARRATYVCDASTPVNPALPYTLCYLAYRIANNAAGAPLDSCVSTLFHTSLFQQERAGGASPKVFRDATADIVSGGKPVPIIPEIIADSLQPLVPSSPVPTASSLTCVVTGGTEGYLENCGCKANQWGGVARRATVIDSIRTTHPGALLLDAGNFCQRPGKFASDEELPRLEQALYFSIMHHLGYVAVAINENELAYGIDEVRQQLAVAGLPTICANVERNGRLLFPAEKVINAGSQPVTIVGLFEPPSPPEATKEYLARAGYLTIVEPEVALGRMEETIRSRKGQVIVIGRLTPPTVRKLVRMYPWIDVVASTANEGPVVGVGRTALGIGEFDHTGRIGKTLVVYSQLTKYGLGEAELNKDGLAYHEYVLDDAVRDDRSTRATIDAFYGNVSRMQNAEHIGMSLLASEGEALHETYVGARACQSCHPAEYEQWVSTDHARAFKTLLDRHRNYQPRCVGCHVVGFGTASGYHIGGKESLANVQCEDCHGPGSAHVAQPSRGNTFRSVPSATCIECHDVEHSDEFTYMSKVLMVNHKVSFRVSAR